MSKFIKLKNYYQEKKQRILFVFFAIGILIVSYIVATILLPVSLGEQKMITIPNGYSLNQTAELLESNGIIQSSFVLRVINKIGPISVKAGTYLFEDYQNIFDVKRRLARGDYGDVYVYLTIPEGTTNKGISQILQGRLPSFDQTVFDTLTRGKEGYLFPDTYAVFPEASTEQVVDMMVKEFEEKITPINDAIIGSSRSLDQIIIMASLIEKEAGDDPQEQKIVSGILWKRFDRNMALQVDAPFLYIQGKTSKELSLDDLRKDGPYNTYTRVGLPPSPIGNPGMNAILAAIYPEPSLYFYYLHDTTGDIHYAVTHDEHVRNKQRYL